MYNQHKPGHHIIVNHRSVYFKYQDQKSETVTRLIKLSINVLWLLQSFISTTLYLVNMGFDADLAMLQLFLIAGTCMYEVHFTMAEVL